MSTRTLHIISFAIPFPANYGGAMDVFYKLKALLEQGISIILHCWKYNNSEQPELEKYCTKVYYYERKKSIALHLSNWPYIVASRTSDVLLENLCLDNHPVLFDGIHTTALVNHPKLRTRKKYLRQHNVEWSYYLQLAEAEPSWWKRIYFQRESKKLKQYETAIIPEMTNVFAVSENDAALYPGAIALPVFQSFQEVKALPGLGSIMLYQADLGIRDNALGARMVAGVAKNRSLPFVVAGKNVPPEVFALSDEMHIRVLDTPDDSVMRNLQQSAQINIINSRINSGMKIKLLQLLLCGRWCFVNEELNIPADLEPLVVRYSIENMQEKIDRCSTLPVEDSIYSNRQVILQKYLPERLAKNLIKQIFGE